MNKKLLCAMLISAMSVNFAAPLISRADDIPEPTETQIAEETQAAEEIYVEEFSAAIDIPTDITDEITVSQRASESYPAIADFVTRLYRTCLNRDPDSTGLDNWVSSIANGQYTAAYAVQGFFSSEEFKKKKLSDKDFVATLYRTMLDREPGQSETDSWVKVRNTGVTDDYMLKGFVESDEFSRICSSSGVTRGSIRLTDVKDKNPNVTAFCSRMYTTCLGRGYDPTGLNEWVDSIINRGNTAADVARGFFNSTEFKNKKLSDSDFVTAYYKTILDRTPAQSEINAWAELRHAGLTNDYFIYGFIGSDEFTKICQNAGVARGNITLTDVKDKNPKIASFCARMYTTCLGRGYDPKGLNDWVNQVVSGNCPASDVVLGFFNSEEFKKRNLSDADYVTAFYKTLLNRAPGQSEIEHWAKLRRAGVSNTYIISGFVGSDEFTNLCANYGMTRGTVNAPGVMLSVMEYSQHPDYPTGCESAALYILLKYYNVNVTMEEIVNALPKGPTPYYSSDGKLYGANPETEFVGNPRSSYSYGVFNVPIANTAEKFKKGVSTKKGASLSEVTSLLDWHIPVIVWYSTKPYDGIYYSDSWYDYRTGELVRWPAGEHAVVVCGYSDSGITYSDPNTGSTRTIPRATFEKVFNQLGGRIVYYGY